jgi:hypothetical protein
LLEELKRAPSGSSSSRRAVSRMPRRLHTARCTTSSGRSQGSHRR